MENGQIILVAGCFNFFCAFLHIFFPKMFQWNRIVSPLAGDDRNSILICLHIMNGCLLFFLFIFGILSMFHAYEIVRSSLGKTLMASLASFWIIRSLVQILIIYGAVKLKKPKNIIMNALVSLVLFITGIILHLTPFIRAV